MHTEKGHAKPGSHFNQTATPLQSGNRSHVPDGIGELLVVLVIVMVLFNRVTRSARPLVARFGLSGRFDSDEVALNETIPLRPRKMATRHRPPPM
jgi:hypothetical protein